MILNRRKNQEAECLNAFDPPISLFEPEIMAGPLVLSSPHSGKLYPEVFLEQSNLSLHTLRQNEDAYIDQLLGFAHHMDIPFISALFPRCFVDVNRAASEIPSSWKLDHNAPSSARAEMGLGVIPSIIADKLPIYKKPLKASCVEDRLDKLYYPYHNGLTHLINKTLQQFGSAILFDVHSMPGFTQMGQRRADIVLGDRHGTSCAPENINHLEALFKNRGYQVTRNHPYAGGYVTSHYGRPNEGVDVIQIEINRDLYLNPHTYGRKTAYARLADDLKSICFEFLATQQSLPLAAE